MAKVLQGNRIAKQGKIAVGSSAAIFDAGRERILLIKRADSGRWAVPGGYMEPGEDFSEACAREVLEETGLVVKVGRLIAVYTDPNLLFAYEDGNAWQLTILHFEADIIGGIMTPDDETTDVRYYSLAETRQLEMNNLDRLRVKDSFLNQSGTIVHNEFGWKQN